jgi:soluble lytic murein transglycosylase-like protein
VRTRYFAVLLSVMFVLGGAAPAAAAVPHTVVAGETLWSIAAANNMSTAYLASYNGLSPEAHVVLGSTVQIPAAGVAAPQAAAPQATAPQPTAQRTSSTQVGSIAAQHSSAPSLATGVAYQESGFNNSVVSSAGARGVMQIMPTTWTFIQENLTPSVRLNPYSTQDNVRAGVLYLDYLRRTMGSEDAAIGAYYQGPNSVRARGFLPETEHYIANVRANQSRFSGTP